MERSSGYGNEQRLDGDLSLSRSFRLEFAIFFCFSLINDLKFFTFLKNIPFLDYEFHVMAI